MGFTRGDAGMVGASKQAATDLNGLTVSGPGRIGTENGHLTGQVEIDKASFTTIENADIKGRGESDILRVLNSKISVLRSQYQLALKLNLGLEGVLKVRLTIDTNGRVRQVEIMENTLKNRRFVSRITSIMRTWRFGAVDTGPSTAILTFPFTSNGRAGGQYVKIVPSSEQIVPSTSDKPRNSELFCGQVGKIKRPPAYFILATPFAGGR
jgi:hypothetical protein